MPRGGLRSNTKVESNHLFKPKWNNKKTTAIRIPEIFKDTLLAIARYLDKPEFLDENISSIQERVINYKTLESNLEFYRTEVFKLQEQNKNLSQTIEKQTNQNKQKNQENKYQIAVECFGEFVESQNLNMKELSKARKGTKKHQLWLINNWFQAQSRSEID